MLFNGRIIVRHSNYTKNPFTNHSFFFTFSLYSSFSWVSSGAQAKVEKSLLQKIGFLIQ